MSHFKDLGLAGTVLRAVEAEGYTTPTPIQAQAIPHLLKGRDLLGIAQTGTGKTAAFALPLLTRLLADPRRAKAKRARVLVLAPTRELAAQICESFRVYGRGARMKTAVVFGGVSYGPQIKALLGGLDVLVATPGRLIDLMERGAFMLDETETVVLDEADHMLDLGFIVPVRRLVARLPARRQSLFFSATMPKEIAALAAEMLTDPVEIAVKPVGTTAERVDQKVFAVEAAGKNALLAHLLQQSDIGRALVFTRTKRGADKVSAMLAKEGVSAAAIHGNKSQSQREKALAAFRRGSMRALVATDIAARGIDVDGVTHVFNYELPDVPESYVHRIGRTARAGASGQAIAFCAPDERANLRGIQKLIRQDIPAFAWSEERGETEISSFVDAGGQGPSGAGRRGGPAKGRNGGGQRSGRPGGAPHAQQTRSADAGKRPHRKGAAGISSGGASISGAAGGVRGPFAEPVRTAEGGARNDAPRPNRAGQRRRRRMQGEGGAPAMAAY